MRWCTQACITLNCYNDHYATFTVVSNLTTKLSEVAKGCQLLRRAFMVDYTTSRFFFFLLFYVSTAKSG